MATISILLLLIGNCLSFKNDCLVEKTAYLHGSNTECDADFSEWNLESLPEEWDVPKTDIILQDRFVTWKYTSNDSSALVGFWLLFQDTIAEESCKLVYKKNSYLAGCFQTSLPRNIRNTTNVIISPLVKPGPGSYERVQWTDDSFLNISGNNIKLVLGLKSIMSLTFVLYRKDRSLVKSIPVPFTNSIVTIKDLEDGEYFYQYSLSDLTHHQLENIECVMSDNVCPCYLRALGKRVCQKCPNMRSQIFRIPTESKHQVVKKSNSSLVLTVTLPVLVILIFCSIAVGICLYKNALCGSLKSKKTIHVWYQTGSDLHNTVVEKFCDVLKHVYDVHSNDICDIKSSPVVDSEAGNFGIFILGGHGVSTPIFGNDLSQIRQQFQLTLVSYSKQQLNEMNKFTEQQKFHLRKQLSELLSHLKISRPNFLMPILSKDLKNFKNALTEVLEFENVSKPILTKKTSENTYTEWETSDNRKQHSMCNDYEAMCGKFDFPNYTDENEFIDHESISIGEKSV